VPAISGTPFQGLSGGAHWPAREGVAARSAMCAIAGTLGGGVTQLRAGTIAAAGATCGAAARGGAARAGAAAAAA
jgi:hypothetical protein